MKNKLLIPVFLLLLSSFCYGQASLRVFNYRPSGEFGFTMKPLVSAELSWQKRFSKRPTKRFRQGVSIMYLNLKPRLEVFPTYGVLYDGNGTTVVPGAQVFNRYSIFQLAAGSDFAFIHQKKYHVFLGADLIAGALFIDYSSNNALYGESYTGNSILAGFRFRLGTEYSISEQIGLFLTINTNHILIADPLTFIRSYDFGLGARYSFD